MRSRTGWAFAALLSLLLGGAALHAQVGGVLGASVDSTPNPLPPCPSTVTKIVGGSGGANVSGLLGATFYGISSGGTTLLSRKDGTNGTGWGNTGAQPAAAPYGFAVSGGNLLEANTENCGGGGSNCNVYSSTDGTAWTANALPNSSSYTAASEGYRGQGNIQCAPDCYAVTRSSTTGCTANGACLAIFHSAAGGTAWTAATIDSYLDKLGTFVGVLFYDGTNLVLASDGIASTLHGCGGSCSLITVNGNPADFAPSIPWSGATLFGGNYYIVSDPSVAGQYKKSTDGGITWSTVTPVFTPALSTATIPTILQSFSTQCTPPTMYMIWTGSTVFSVYTSTDGTNFTRIYNEANPFIGGNIVYNPTDTHFYFGAFIVGTTTFQYYKLS